MTHHPPLNTLLYPPNRRLLRVPTLSRDTTVLTSSTQPAPPNQTTGPAVNSQDRIYTVQVRGTENYRLVQTIVEALHLRAKMGAKQRGHRLAGSDTEGEEDEEHVAGKKRKLPPRRRVCDAR